MELCTTSAMEEEEEDIKAIKNKGKIDTLCRPNLRI